MKPVLRVLLFLRAATRGRCPWVVDGRSMGQSFSCDSTTSGEDEMGGPLALEQSSPEQVAEENSGFELK